VGESGEGEDITSSVLEHQGDLRVGAGQHPGDFIKLGQDVRTIEATISCEPFETMESTLRIK